MVAAAGVEPACPKAADFKSAMYTSFIMRPVAVLLPGLFLCVNQSTGGFNSCL